MASIKIDNIKLIGISGCVPKNRESNLDYDWISIAEREMLIKTTGIKYRRIASKETCTSDMCFESANKLIQDLKIDKNEIEILLFVSQSPDYFLPATSIILQDRLGLSKSTIAFDIQLGCSGYVYGLSVISSLMSSGKFNKGLLLVGDKSSFSQSKKDKSTYPIFGDAGTATILQYDESAQPMYFNLQSDGSGYKSIIIPDGGLRSPITSESDKIEKISEGIERSRRNLSLDGIEVFNFSVREAAPNVKSLLEEINKGVDDYDYFLMHQANLLMNESIRKKIGFPKEKTPYSLHDYGNTSSASIPLTMVSQLANIISNKPTNFLLSAFGVGLSWGSASITQQSIYCPPIIEI